MAHTLQPSPESLAGGRRDLRSLWQTYWPLVVLGVLAMVVAIVAHHTLFPAYSWNRDEPVYIWQAEALRSGQVRTTDGTMPESFRPWLSAAEDGVVFSHFPVGWPLALLASDVVFGSPDAALALACLLAVVGTYALARELTCDHTLALVAAGVMVASPILAVQGGIYLGYIFTLGLGVCFSAALLSGVRRALPSRLALAGFLLGWILLSRPFDAVLWAAAAGGSIAFVRRREWRDLLRAARWFALGLVPMLVVTIAYNHIATRSFTQFPNTASDPLDKFGFGKRRIMPGFGLFGYGLKQAVAGTARNAFWTPMFLAGSYLGAIAAGFGLWLRRREPSSIALLAIMAVFPVGYFFFWGTSISALTTRLSGPIYFVPLYAPLSILIATTILFAWHRRRAFGIGALALLVAATVPAAVNRFSVNRELSEVQIPWKTSTKGIHGKSLVFVSESGRYLMFLNPYSSNDADLSNRLLYAADRGPRDLAVIAANPDRTPYLQRALLPTLEMGPQTYPTEPKITVTRLRVLRARSVVVQAQITNPTGQPVIGAFIRIGSRLRWRTVSDHATRGATYTMTWRIDMPREAGSASPSHFSLSRRSGYVVVGVGYGPTARAARSHPKFRQTYSYRVHDSSIEMLVPPVADAVSAKRGIKGELVWKPIEKVRALGVTAVAAAPSAT